MKIKKSFVAFGVCMALAGTLFAAALPWRYSHHAHALVLVKDPNNIAEAIKMVNYLTNVLDNEQMQIALQLLQMKKLDENTLFSLWNLAKTNKEFSEMIAKGETGKWGDVLYRLDGMLSGKSSIPMTWQQGLGEVTDILDGELGKAGGGCFGSGKPGMVVLNSILKDTATVAQMGQISDVEVAKMAMKAYEQGQKAEGQLQATQAGNAINLAALSILQNGNRTLNHLAAASAANYQRALTKEAWELRERVNTAEAAWQTANAMHTYGTKF